MAIDCDFRLACGVMIHSVSWDYTQVAGKPSCNSCFFFVFVQGSIHISVSLSREPNSADGMRLRLLLFSFTQSQLWYSFAPLSFSRCHLWPTVFSGWVSCSDYSRRRRGRCSWWRPNNLQCCNLWECSQHGSPFFSGQKRVRNFFHQVIDRPPFWF